MRAERGLQRRKTLERGLGTQRLVAGGEPPAGVALDGDRDEVGLDLAGIVGGGRLLLAAQRIVVGALLGELREPVVDLLRGVAHVERLGVHELLGEEARVRVDAGAHRVVAHVLDPARQREVVCTEGDAARDRGDGRHRARAHPVDREAGNGLGEAREQRGRAPDGQALVAGLGGRGDGHVVDAILRQIGMAFEQSDHRLDDEVVGPGVPVHAFFARAPEGGAYPVDEHDFMPFGHNALLSLSQHRS